VGNTTLTIEQIPSHNHKIWGQDNTASPSGNPSNEVANIENPGTGSAYFQRNSDTAGGGGSHTHTFTGTSQTNLPPYYALAYIMKL
jgi:microcystin-dependent protein